EAARERRDAEAHAAADWDDEDLEDTRPPWQVSSAGEIRKDPPELNEMVTPPAQRASAPPEKEATQPVGWDSDVEQTAVTSSRSEAARERRDAEAHAAADWDDEDLEDTRPPWQVSSAGEIRKDPPELNEMVTPPAQRASAPPEKEATQPVGWDSDVEQTAVTSS